MASERERTIDAEIWLQAWLAVGSASNTRNSDTPTKWADICLADYRKRFGGEHRESDDA